MWTFKNNLVITIRYRVRHRTQWKCFIKLWNKMNTNKPKSKRTTGKCSTPKSHNKNCKNTSNSNSSHNLRDSLDDSNQTIKLKLRQDIVIIMKICQINMIQMEEIDKGIKRIKKIQKINSKMADIYKHFCKKKIKIKVLNLNRNKICNSLMQRLCNVFCVLCDINICIVISIKDHQVYIFRKESCVCAQHLKTHSREKMEMGWKRWDDTGRSKNVRFPPNG